MPDLRTADEAEMAALQLMGGGRQPEKLMVEFTTKPQQDAVKTKEAGRPIFVEVVFIEIRVPGDMREIRCRPARLSGGAWNPDPFQESGDVNKIPDDIRFARQWEQFQKKATQVVSGTPLDAIPFLTKTQVAEFKAANCETAEQVRDMSDVNAQRFMGMHGLRRKIGVYLDAAAGGAPAQKLADELQERDDKIALQEGVLAEQGKKIEAMMAQMAALTAAQSAPHAPSPPAERQQPRK